MMTVRAVIFGSVGILLALAALCLLVVWWGKKFQDERYDERQKIARGDAYRFSFWIGEIGWFGIMIYMIWSVDHEPVVEPYLLMYLCLGVQAIGFHMYCLMTHSALPFDEKPFVLIGGYGIMGVMHLLIFFTRDIKEVLPLLGHGTSVWMSLILGSFFLILAAMYLIGALVREKE